MYFYKFQREKNNILNYIFYIQIYSTTLENPSYGETMARNPSLAAICFLLGAGGNLPEDDVLTETGDANIKAMLQYYANTYCCSPEDEDEDPSWRTTCSIGSTFF